MKPTLAEQLQAYFDNPPREQIVKDWESTAEWDETGVRVSDLFPDILDEDDVKLKIEKDYGN